jgi:hypothetical protein
MTMCVYKEIALRRAKTPGTGGFGACPMAPDCKVYFIQMLGMHPQANTCLDELTAPEVVNVQTEVNSDKAVQ